MHVPEIRPTPSLEEAAAISVAIEVLTPKPVAIDVAGDRHRSFAWRFSGRWWQRDRFARHDRPWS